MNECHAHQRHEAAIELGSIGSGYRRRRKATRTLDALTLAWMRNERASLELVRLMSHEADGEGRSTADADPNLVNGTEVRWSERWLMPTDPNEDYETVTTRIGENGTRKAFTAHLEDRTPERATNRPAPSGETYAERLARLPMTQADID